jgi:hypothetical protein
MDIFQNLDTLTDSIEETNKRVRNSPTRHNQHPNSLPHRVGGDENSESMQHTVSRGIQNSNALLVVGMEVEAKPKKIGTESNYRYHRAVIHAVLAEMHCYDVRLLDDPYYNVIVERVPRFAIMTLDEIATKEAKRLQDRLRNSGGGSARSGTDDNDESSANMNHIARMKVPRQLGNSTEDIKSLQQWISK